MGLFDTLGSIAKAPFSLVGGAVGGIGSSMTQQNGYHADPVQLPGYTDQQARFAAAIQAAQNHQGPQIGQTQMNTAPQDQFRNGQMSFIQALQNQAAGNGPSVAQAQLNQATDANTANQMAMAASSRGGNPALAERIAAQNAAQVAQGNAATAATGRMQEQLSAQGILGGALNQGRAQDLGLASDQAGLTQQRNIAQAQADMTTNAQNNQASLGYSGLSMDAAKAQEEGALDAQKINAGVAQGNATAVNDASRGVLGGAAGILTKAATTAAHGGMIPGKAAVRGDSGVNDTVPAMLSPGEAVVPRSKMGDPAKAKAFIDHLMKTKASPQQEAMSYGKVLEAHRKLKASMGEMEKALKAKGKK